MARRFRKKPVEVEVMQYRGGMDSRDEIVAWSGGKVLEEEGRFLVVTLEGPMRVSPWDWIVKGVEGEFYPVKDSIFQKTYESVED